MITSIKLLILLFYLVYTIKLLQNLSRGFSTNKLEILKIKIIVRSLSYYFRC